MKTEVFGWVGRVCRELGSRAGVGEAVTAPLLSWSLQLHAEYCRDKDAYLPHRLVQAWELAQFIR